MSHCARRASKPRCHVTFAAAAGLVAILAASPAGAVPEKGTVIQTDTLGMNMVSYNFDTSKTTTVADTTGLTEFLGAHYFFAEGWRVGMNFQFTEVLSALGPKANHFSTFAMLPQVGWHFYGPMYAALVFTFAPRTSGGANLDMGFQGVFGASVPVNDRLSVSAGVEVPYNFYIHNTIGVTPLLGVSFRL